MKVKELFFLFLVCISFMSCVQPKLEKAKIKGLQIATCDESQIKDQDGNCVSADDGYCPQDLQMKECRVENGVGSQTFIRSPKHQCNFVPSGSCVLEKCLDGFVLSKNTCVPKINVMCVEELSQQCQIENGLGLKSRTCTNGVYTDFSQCQVQSCNPGYVISENSCVLDRTNQGGGFSQSSGASGVPRTSDLRRVIGLFENPTVDDTFTGNVNEIVYYTAVYPVPPNIACGESAFDQLKVDDSDYIEFLNRNNLFVEISPIGAKYNGANRGLNCHQHLRVRLPIERLTSGNKKRIDLVFDTQQSVMPSYFTVLNSVRPTSLSLGGQGSSSSSRFVLSQELVRILNSDGIKLKLDYQEEVRLGVSNPVIENKTSTLDLLQSGFEVVSSSDASITLKSKLRLDTFSGIFYFTFFHQSPVVELQARLTASNFDGNPRVVYHINELELSSNIPMVIHSKNMIGAKRKAIAHSGFAVTYDFIDIQNKIELVDSQGFAFFAKMASSLTNRAELDLSLGTSTNWNKAGRGWAFLKDPHNNTESDVIQSIQNYRTRIMGEMTRVRLAMEDISAIGCAGRPGIPGGQACFSAYIDLPSYFATLDPLAAQFHVSSVHAEESHRPGFFMDRNGNQILDFPFDGPNAVYFQNGLPKAVSLNFGAKQEFVNSNWPDGRSKQNNGFTGYDKQHFSVTHLAMSYLLSGKESLLDQVKAMKLTMKNNFLPSSLPINGGRVTYVGNLSAMRAPGRVLESLFSLHQALDDQSFVDHMMVWFNDRIYSEFERVQNFRYPFFWRGGYTMCGESYIGYSSWMMGIMFNGLWAAYNLTGDMRIKRMLEVLYPTYIETNFRLNGSGEFETAYRVHPNNYDFFPLTEQNFLDPCKFDGINSSPMGTVLWSFTATSLADHLNISQAQKNKARAMYSWLNNHERWTERGAISDATVWFTPAIDLWE